MQNARTASDPGILRDDNLVSPHFFFFSTPAL